MPKPTALEIPWKIARKLEEKAASEGINPANLALIYLFHGLLKHEQIIISEKKIRDETLSEYPKQNN